MLFLNMPLRCVIVFSLLGLIFSGALGSGVENVLMVEFSQNVFTGSESSGIVPVSLLLRGGTADRDISVTVIPSDQSPLSAEGNGVDYTSTPITATFTAGATTTTVNVPVTMDNIAEQSETFDLSFAIPPALSGDVVPGNIATAVGNITDITIVFICFVNQTLFVPEDDIVVVVTINITNPLSTDVTLTVDSTDVTATGGIDYVSGPYTVTILAGQTSASFNLRIINDNNTFEGNETFTLTIRISSLPDRVMALPTCHLDVTIVDNDCTFDQTTYAVTIISNPTGTIVTGSVNTFDHPILSRITLTCNVTSSDGSPFTVTNYQWNTTGCFTNDFHNVPTCFAADMSTKTVIGNNILAEDAGEFICIATIGGVSYASRPLSLRISGVEVIGAVTGDPGINLVNGNQIADYSFITQPFIYDPFNVIFRCASGQGPTFSDRNTVLGGWYFQGTQIPKRQGCTGPVFEVRGANSRLYPGVINLYLCGTFTSTEEGVYSCVMRNSSMVEQTVRVGVYFSGRTVPMIDPSSSSAVAVVFGSPLTLLCTSRGSPPDTFTWRKDNGPIVESTRVIKVTHNDTLAEFSAEYSIASVAASNIGRYTCTVTNPIGSDSKAITVTASLNSPTNVGVIVLSPRIIRVTWIMSSFAGVTGYYISYNTSAPYAANGKVKVDDANTTGIIISNLEEYTLYNISVQAIGYNNVTSLKSTEVTVTTWSDVPSSPPVIIELISVNPASIRLSLQNPAEVDRNGLLLVHVIQYYTSQFSDSSFSIIVAGGVTNTITELIPFTNYSVQVAVANVNGTGPFSAPMVQVSGEAQPSMPRFLVVQDVTYSSATLSWHIPTSPNGIILQYKLLYRKLLYGSSSQFVEISLQNTNFNYTIAGLTSNTRYQFQVRAVNSFAEGLNAEVYIQTSISPPTNVAGTLELPQSIAVTWIPSSSVNVTGYLISYTVVPFTEVERIRVDGANSTRYTIDNLEEFALYIISLQAIGSSNATSVSSTGISITTKTVAPTVPPMNVTITSARPASFNISWQMLSKTEYNISISGIEIRYSRIGSNVTMSVIVANETMHKLSGLTAFSLYYIQVAFIALNKTGAFTPPAIYVSGEDKPSAPQLLRIRSAEYNQVNVYWIAPNPPNGRILEYVLEYRRLDAPFLSVSINGTRTMYTIDGLTADTEYEFTLKACTIEGCGPITSSIFETTCHADNNAFITMITTVIMNTALVAVEGLVWLIGDDKCLTCCGFILSVIAAVSSIVYAMVNYFICHLEGSYDIIAVIISAISIGFVIAVLYFTIVFILYKKEKKKQDSSYSI